MKQIIILLAILVGTDQLYAQQANNSKKHLYIDVHYLPGGKATAADVAAAHAKDLAVQDKFGVKFKKYWVDEARGIVYCLSSASDSINIREAHRQAHGLVPQEIMEVTEGIATPSQKGKPYFLDVHRMGAGKVTAKDVAAAHKKDLAVQKKYGVNCINYWVDEKKGIVVCLAQAPDSSKMIDTHRDAHGLLPDYIALVKQGQ